MSSWVIGFLFLLVVVKARFGEEVGNDVGMARQGRAPADKGDSARLFEDSEEVVELGFDYDVAGKLRGQPRAVTSYDDTPGVVGVDLKWVAKR
jgi:hypothetical protein